MKKTILTLIIILLTVSASFSQTFRVGGVHRGGTSPTMKQQTKARIKSEMKLTDDQVNAIAVIEQDYRLKARAVKIDTKTTDKEKKEKLQPVEEERRESLKKILSEEQIDKLDELIKNAPARRQRAAA